MAKIKTAFYCQNCGAQYSQWMGKCKACNEWNTIVEEVVSRTTKKSAWNKEASQRANKALNIQEISLENEPRIDTGDNELLTESNCHILTETNTQNIFQQVMAVQPELLVVDSIQTLQTNIIDSSPGSISQIRECTTELIKYAKESDTPVLLIGHINKDGHIAGPKILEHMVDVVLQFEGDRNHVYRI